MGDSIEIKGIRTKEPFDERCGYAEFIELTGDKIVDQYAVTDLLATMCGYIPIDHLSGVIFIFHPLGTAGTGFLEDGEKSTFAWKYAYKKYQKSKGIE